MRRRRDIISFLSLLRGISSARTKAEKKTDGRRRMTDWNTGTVYIHQTQTEEIRSVFNNLHKSSSFRETFLEMKKAKAARRIHRVSVHRRPFLE